MKDGWAKGGLFSGGLALGAVAAVAAYLYWFAPKAPQPLTPEAQFAAEARIAADPAPGATSVAALPQASSTCPFEPLLGRASASDGQFALRAALATNRVSDPSGFIVAAEEAAGQGRVRDAEVAWIMACRVAGEGGGPPATPMADIKSELAQHYASRVAREAASDRRLQLLRRSELLFGESVRIYTLALGKNASKTRRATQGLESVTQAAAWEASNASAAGTSRDAGPTASSPPATSEPAAERRIPLQAATGQASDGPDTGGQDSGPCAQARSAAQRLVCSDPELGQMESDLARMRSQAQAVTRDPAGFQRRQQQAAAQRDSGCQDKACVEAWYAKRKRQLIDEF